MSVKSHKKQEKGQGLVEYALILVLVAIVVVVIMALLGPAIGGIFSQVNTALGGGDGLAQYCQDHSVESGTPFFTTEEPDYGLAEGYYTCP